MCQIVAECCKFQMLQVSVDLKSFCATIFLEDSDEISYRGFEAVDCFGMQFTVEPARGLCGNHKPNRFIESKENVLLGLAYARSFFGKGGQRDGCTK